jgi:adenylate cyclase
MSNSASSNAWLEAADGQSIPVSGICSLGRSRNNQVILKDTKASRRHAMIHPQGQGEYWLVDFGSTNGTLLNGRRVIQPSTLSDRDQIVLASETYVFRKSNEPGTDVIPLGESSLADAVTCSEIRNISCWMLITDIEDSTRFSQTCPAEQLPVLLGRWFLSCKETIDECNGQINKFLGDGFFAYWPDHPTAATHVVNALRKLSEAQKATPPFRWVLHFGPVSVGGSTSLGEESLLGSEVNFAFRMEKLAGKLGLHRMLSDAARAKVDLGVEPEKVGPHELNGFDGGFFFHTY